jgi:hypothetical protein
VAVRRYQLIVEGELTDEQELVFGGFTLTRAAGTTTLTGFVHDQAELQGLLLSASMRQFGWSASLDRRPSRPFEHIVFEPDRAGAEARYRSREIRSSRVTTCSAPAYTEHLGHFS